MNCPGRYLCASVRRRLALLALALFALAGMSGCGSAFLWSAAPAARLDPPPGTYDEPVHVAPRRRDGERFYVSMSPDTAVGSFRPFYDWVHIPATTTFWYYAISSRGVRSPVIEATYTIEGVPAPVVARPHLWTEDRKFLSYEVVWDVDEGVNPTDAHTSWYDLEYAVYSSPHSDIASFAQAVAAGRLEMGWSRYTNRFLYRAGRPGESRYFNVFVRNEAGRVSAYNARRFSSIPAQSVVFFDTNLPQSLLTHVHRVGGDFEPNLATDLRWLGLTGLKALDLGHVESAPLSDLAVVESDGSNDFYRWYRPVGNGFYDTGNPTTLYVESPSAAPRMIRIAPIGRPGVSDFVFTTGTGDIQIVSRSGAEIATIPGVGALRFVIGDVTGNGANDIVTLGPAGIMVFGNSGEASFSLVSQAWDGLGAPTDLRDIALADLDRDGRLDLIVARQGSPAVLLFFGNGDGTFTRPGGEEGYWPHIAEATNLSVLDFTRNGLPDLFVGAGAGQLSQIFTNNGDRTFYDPDIVAWSNEGSQDSLVADLNGNGWPDLIETFVGPTPPRIWLNYEGSNLVPSMVMIESEHTGQIAVGQIR